MDKATSPVADGGDKLKIGLLEFIKPSLGIADLGFHNGSIIITVALRTEQGSIDWGASSTAETTVTNLEILFDLGVGGNSDFIVSPTGKFSVFASNLVIDVPDAINVQAENILIAYDPNGAADQELFRADSVIITFLTLKLKGSLTLTTLVMRSSQALL